jgi:hypothetical protein
VAPLTTSVEYTLVPNYWFKNIIFKYSSFKIYNHNHNIHKLPMIEARCPLYHNFASNQRLLSSLY